MEYKIRSMSDPGEEWEISIEELRMLRALNQGVDDVLEESLKARENLAQSFRRAFPAILELTGAKAVVITTPNEELAEETWHQGDFRSEERRVGKECRL